MDIGKAMRDLREAAGVSRAALATKLNIRPESVWKIEKGKSWPKPATVVRFCEVIGIPIAYLYAKAMTIEDYIWPRPKADEDGGIPADGQTQIVDKV